MSDLTCRVMLLFLRLCTSSPKGALKTLVGPSPKKSMQRIRSNLQSAPERRFASFGVSRWNLKHEDVWHWAVSCTQTCTHLWMAHTLCTHEHMCVCSDSLNNNVLLPYWSSGYFSNIFNDVVLHFQRKSFTFKNKRCSSEFFPADQNHFDVTQAHFSSRSRWYSLPLEKDDNGLAECKFYYVSFSFSATS